jgi:hypothetical protein
MMDSMSDPLIGLHVYSFSRADPLLLSSWGVECGRRIHLRQQ